MKKKKVVFKNNSLTTDPTNMNYCICHDMIENGLDMSETTYKSKWYKGFRLIHTCGFYSLEFKDTLNTVEIIYCPWCGRKLSHSDFVEERKYKAFKELEWNCMNECKHEWSKPITFSYTSEDLIFHYKCSKCGKEKALPLTELTKQLDYYGGKNETDKSNLSQMWRHNVV